MDCFSATTIFMHLADFFLWRLASIAQVDTSPWSPVMQNQKGMVILQGIYPQGITVAGLRHLFPDSAEAASGLRSRALIGMNMLARMELVKSG